MWLAHLPEGTMGIGDDVYRRHLQTSAPFGLSRRATAGSSTAFERVP